MWIMAESGDLVNMIHQANVNKRKNANGTAFEVRAWEPGEGACSTTLFSGTNSECDKYISDLLSQLGDTRCGQPWRNGQGRR